MKQEQKLMATGVVLAALLGGVYVVRKGEEKDAQAHSVTAAKDLPSIKVDKEKLDKIDKLEIKNKDKDAVTLVKKDDKWVLDKPLAAEANQSNVDSLIKNLEKIEVKALIAQGTEQYEKYELTDDSAVHVVAYAGADKLLDAYFGKGGSRGQMSRIAGTDAVYAVKGYSSYLYGREVKNWRNNEVLKFEDKNVVAVEIENKHAKYSFSKNDESWSASLFKRGDSGKLAGKAATWDEFEPKKVGDMLRAYKNLRSTDFAAKDADSGVDAAATEGGVVKISLKDDGGEHILKVGKSQEGSNRYLAKEGDETVYVVSSWAADWATAEPTKFQKAEEKPADDKDGDKGDDDAKKDDDKDAKKGDAKKDAKAAGKAAKPAPKKPAPKAPAPKAPPAKKPSGGAPAGI
jgi:hypothetical protein